MLLWLANESGVRIVCTNGASARAVVLQLASQRPHVHAGDADNHAVERCVLVREETKG
jgi:hypothetical protein